MLRASSQCFEVKAGALASVSPLAGLTTIDAPQAYTTAGAAAAASGECIPRASSRPAPSPVEERGAERGADDDGGAAAAAGQGPAAVGGKGPVPLAATPSTSDDRCLFEVPLVEVRVAM